MTKRVMVTGGAGFIGSHVAGLYIEQGYDVTVLDDLSSGKRENVPEAAQFVEADVGSPEAQLLLERGGFTVLNHHAAQMDVRVSVRDPMLDARINLVGLLNLLEGARAGGVERVLFASSGGVVYGESDALPHPEEAGKLPVSPYGVSKLGSEYYLAQYSLLYGMTVRSLRYANVYGPRQNPHGEAGVVAIFGSRIRHRQPITVYGDGAQTRDYVYVADVARASLAATTDGETAVGSIDDVAYNIGTGIETSVNALAAAMLDATGISVPIKHGPARPGELQRSAVAIAKARGRLGWEPQVDLVEGLRRTYEWIEMTEG